MTREPLDGPLEVGIRSLAILTQAYPARLDLAQLTLLDHCVLHSGDVGGPPSIHPPLPLRVSELSIKRAAISEGLAVLAKSALIEVNAGSEGIVFSASETAHSFLSLLESPYARQLLALAAWLMERFVDLSEQGLRQELASVFGQWAEEIGEGVRDEGLLGWQV